jgi:3'-5' exonuclease
MNRNATYLVHDIETVGTELGWDPATAPPTPTGEPPVPPIWAMRIVAIAMMPLDIDLIPTGPAVLARPKTEPEMIASWAQAVAGRRCEPLTLVDFNGRSFDLPVLQTRAFHYGIDLSFYFALQPDNRGGISQWSKEYRDRYGGRHHDLRDWWGNRGGFVATKLEHLARLMGLPGKLGMDGSQIETAWRAGEQDRIDRYCLADVIQTGLVFARMQLTAGRLSRDAYRGAVMAILDAAASDPSQAELVAAIDRERVMAVEVS